MSQGINLLGGRHLLQALGLDPLFFQQLEQFQDQLGPLEALQDQFQTASGGLSPLALASMLKCGIPGQCMVAPPNQGRCGCGQSYARPKTFDFGRTEAPPSSPQGMMARIQGSMFERFLKSNPHARQQFEMAMGGRILPDGSNDGRVTIQPFGSGYFPAGGGDAYAAAMAMFNQMNPVATTPSQGYPPQAYSRGMFQSLMLSGLQNIMAQQMAQGAGGAAPGAYSTQGQFQAGAPGAAQGAFAMGPSDGSDVAGVLNDPSLTVEDKVTLMLMLIMKQEDKEIEQEANYVNQLQQQQNQGGGKGKGKGKGGGGPDGSSPSIDVETMKLKRLIDKRSQMFDMLRQIVDKYNQTAKGIIDSMGR